MSCGTPNEGTKSQREDFAEAEKSGRGLVVPSGDATVVFQLVEEALDAGAQRVEPPVGGVLRVPTLLGGDFGSGASIP